eukprot:CAMPEP_0185033458 /NCGR_PEP_ID=MMETSP1103-20130426/22415_1 /TAXON_ID=36769 /ORGANISM="Paraphysomonas bandaiensis, Strain Caron Lab Isolate" /LENGTH=205 /DNA_ID=CAMNT_0027569733 /DNA_START=637 /DNA_END=1254 /DNA_ORIENTATION=-
MVDNHRSTTCPEETVKCELSILGCEAMVKRKDLASHNSDLKAHIPMMMSTILSQQRMITSQQRTIQQLQSKCATTELVFTIPGFSPEKIYRSHRQSVEGREFFLEFRPTPRGNDFHEARIYFPDIERDLRVDFTIALCKKNPLFPSVKRGTKQSLVFRPGKIDWGFPNFIETATIFNDGHIKNNGSLTLVASVTTEVTLLLGESI